MSINCMFCLEPVGADDLAIPLLPCQCRTPHHDSCRATWNAMNPYRCPICRKTFKSEPMTTRHPLPERYQEHTYVVIPSAPAAPSPVQPPRNTAAQPFQINLKKVFIICAAVLIGVMFIILMKNLWS